MNAGRELDAQVAEKVMGWTRDGSGWLTPEGKTRSIEMTSYGSFRPSEEMNAAFEVVEKLRLWDTSLSYVFEMFDNSERNETQGEWWVRFDEFDAITDTSKEVGWTSACTPPLAICLAALRAVGVEVDAMEDRAG